MRKLIHLILIYAANAAPRRRRNQLKFNFTTPVILNDPKDFVDSQYDFVIIGGGTAGLALAARLSEDGVSTVGVLEAGSNGLDDPSIEIPGAGSLEKYKWNFTTTAANGVPAMNWTRGKVLGGTSAVDNWLMWDRSSRSEIDAWAEFGNWGWNWGNILPAIRNSEKYMNNGEGHSFQFGSGGPVKVSSWNAGEIMKRWISAFSSVGVKLNEREFNGNNIGVTFPVRNVDPQTGRKSYSANAYLASIQHRWNLKVLPNALVTKIRFADVGQKKEARVVEFLYGNKTYQVETLREVILSAGPVATPQILELSGIGNKTRLAQLGIRTIIDLPSVGENLQDHIFLPIVYKIQDGIIEKSPDFSGQLPISTVAHITLETAVGQEKYSEILTRALREVAGTKLAARATLERQVQWLRLNAREVAQLEFIGVNGFYGPGVPEPEKSYFTILVSPGHLLSRGSVHVKALNPQDAPEIQPNYLSSDFDLEALRAGVEFIRKIMATPSFTNIEAEEVLPGKETDLDDYARRNIQSQMHPIGTASLLPLNRGGAVNNGGGVVNACLRVYGISNLRVVDSSIIPLHISVDPQSTIYGISEFASLILRGRSQYCQ